MQKPIHIERPVVQVRGSGQSAPHLLFGSFLLRIQFDGPMRVELQRMTARGWASAVYESNCEQLIKAKGERLRLVATGDAAGTAEIVRAG